ncbi:MAG: Imidazolonepropionase [Planctomycetes bacterium]|nr:Imidazolonepropionase [Planctomycetota bacterium]
MAKEPCDLLVRSAAELLTMDAGPAAGPLRGEALREPGMLADGAIAVTGGRIAAVGRTADLRDRFAPREEIDATGRVVMPGFVDPHTHLVFGRTREDEFEMRCLGMSYEEIAAAGGGIRASARRFRALSRDAILSQARALRASALRHGSTTVEVKSGYGLSTESEVLSLEIAREIDADGDVVPTFLGAHEVPDEWRHDRAGYVRLVIDEMLPRVAARGLARFCDVFCEAHVFTPDETRAISLAAKRLGLGVKLHADELAGTGGAELAVELGAVSADHLMAVSDAGIAALAGSETVAVLLPGTSFFLGMKRFAPARRMIEAGVAVALATDCNPGSSYTESPQQVATLACVGLGLRPVEALAAFTRNAACAVGLGHDRGRLAPGYRADLVVLDVPNHRHVAYHHGVNHASCVVRNGGTVRGPDLPDRRACG